MMFAVVFITSNYIGNSEIMEGCKEAGIPCFGTLWDFVRCYCSSNRAISNTQSSERHKPFLVLICIFNVV